MPQPGWYPSPNDPEKLTFWDGAQWTGQTMDRTAAAQPEQPLSRRALREQRSEGISMALPMWDAKQERPTHLPAPESEVEAGADEGGFTLGDGTVVEPVTPEAMPHPYVFDSPEPEPPADDVDDLYAALQVTPEEAGETVAATSRQFSELAEGLRSEWSDDSQAVYEAASVAFQQEAAHVYEPVPTEAPSYPEAVVPIPTVVEPLPTVVEPLPTVVEPVATEPSVIPSEPLPGFQMPRPSLDDAVVVDTSVWGNAAPEPSDDARDDDFDAALGVAPLKKRVSRANREKSAPRATEPLLERNREPAARQAVAPRSKAGRLAFLSARGMKSGLVTAVVGLVVALGALTAVPAALDPTPAGGAVQAGEQRATAQVRELNMDIDGYCHPTVEVPTGFGSFEVLALKLHELNTACPVKVGESVTVYYEPNSGGDARYVRAGTVPVDLIMWSVFGIGFLAAAWGALRGWSVWKDVRIPLVTPKAQPSATLA